jgi:uncharacterized protein
MMEAKVKKLEERIKSLSSAVISFSGGVDSAVLTFVAHKVLDKDMVAVTGDSFSVPSRDLNSAISFCKGRNIPHVIVKTDEFKDETYRSNPENRCFYCKSALFDCLQKIAVEKTFKYIVEGTNASELTGHRPGHMASKSRTNVVTPFVDLGFSKEDVREIARYLNLEVADKPSTACLSSRIPIGTKIEPEILRRIDNAENFLIDLGIKQVRVRHTGDTARVESDDVGMKICLEKRDEIVDRLASFGWKNVTLDLKGYRTGGGM